MELLPNKVKVSIEGRDVHIQAWKYDVQGATGGVLPILFLDTDLPENDGWDRGITYHLYGGDDTYRFKQEVVLGIGGVRMLHDLGYPITKFHMNEGHAALLTLELLRRHKQRVESTWDERAVWNDASGARPVHFHHAYAGRSRSRPLFLRHRAEGAGNGILPA
jgi:starch phosphorylase